MVVSNKYYDGINYNDVVDSKGYYANAHYDFSYALNEGTTFFRESDQTIVIPKTADFSDCQPKVYLGLYNTIDVDSKDSVDGIFIHKYNNI